MEADSSRGVTPEQEDPAPATTERNEHLTSERIRGSDLMVTQSGRLGIHQVLDQIETIASPVLQFTHKWREIHEEYASLQSLLKKRAVELDLKERSVRERIVELEKKEERLKDVEERLKPVALSLEEKEKEKRYLVSSLLMRLDCETTSEAAMVLEKKGKEIERLSKCNDDRSRELDKAVKEFEAREKKLSLVEEAIKEKVIELEKKEKIFEVELKGKTEKMKVKEKQLEEREKEVERISKCNDDKLRELEKAVKEFDLKQKKSLKQLEVREKKLSLVDESIKEKGDELEKKEEIFEAEQKAKAEETELKCREKLAEVEKKEIELKAKAEKMDVKEKQVEEREKVLELKQRELEQVMDKLKEKEKETNSASLASASVSSPQQRDKACEEEEPEIVDSEFHDFKKTMSSFVVDKTWALYDPQDEMPRLYAKIKRVNKSQLSLDVKWVEPKEEDESVPVAACGRFKYGRTETMSYLTFSHEVKPIIHGRNISVNPKEGETWALFNPIQHKPPYKYDLVEVLKVYHHQGVGVAYLGKVEGFVSVFKHTVQHGVVKQLIGPKEIKRFSHRVPSVRLNGEEKEGVPAGSFELDPAAVPRYILFGEKEPDVVVQVSSAAEDVPLVILED